MSSDPDVGSITAWLLEWQKLIRAEDFVGAQTLFDPDVIGFGTRVNQARGIDELVAHQWRVTWPTIEGFAFDLDNAVIRVAGHRLAALVATLWSSIGNRPLGDQIDRGGRATIVLVREERDAPWKAIHTHFSLTEGLETP